MSSTKFDIGLFLSAAAHSAQGNRQLVQVGKWLAKRGHSVTIISGMAGSSQKLAKKKLLDSRALESTASALDFERALQLRRIIKQEGIRVMLFRDPTDSNLMSATKFLMKGALRLVLFQERSATRFKSDTARLFALNQMDAWVVPLNTLAQEVRAETSLPPARIHVLQYPLRRRAIANPTKKEGLRKQLKSDRDQLLIACQRATATALSADMQTLLSAARDLCNSGRLKILVSWPAGHNGSEDSALDEVLQKLHIKQGVLALGEAKSLYKYLAACDAVYVLPDAEPFEGTSQRALASGIPCLAPHTSITNDLFNYGELGMLHARGNEEELSHLLARICADKSLLKPYQNVVSRLIRSASHKDQFCENLERALSAS